MNPKTLVTLGAITVAVAGAAAWVATRTPPGVSAQPSAGGPLLPRLRERVNDVAQVQVTTSAESFVLARQDGRWGLADKGGYPVDIDRVKELVVGLSELTLVEVKTANPDLWPRLEVQDPGSDPEAPSKRVRLSSEDGEVLADLVVGRQDIGAGPGRGTVFVRKAEDGPALEARGRVTLEGSAAGWLDRQIVKLERKRVREVVITHPDGEVLTVRRDSPEEQDFEVADLPEGAELAWAGVAGGLAGALEYLNLEDVEPASESALDPGEAVTARFTTFDGLVVTATTVERDDEVLLAVAAQFDEQARAAEPAGPPAPTAEGSEPPAGEPARDGPGKSSEEVADEAVEIGARVQDWVYVVPGYSGANLRKRLDDLLKKEEEVDSLFIEEEPGGEVPTPAGAGEESGSEPGSPPEPATPTEPEEPTPEPTGGGGGGGGGR